MDADCLDMARYDPWYFPETPSFHSFRTVYCGYVLNVLYPEERAACVRRAKCCLDDDPRSLLYIAVRRNIPKEGIQRKGYRQHYVVLQTGDGTESILKRPDFEIYIMSKHSTYREIK